MTTSIKDKIKQKLSRPSREDEIPPEALELLRKLIEVGHEGNFKEFFNLAKKIEKKWSKNPYVLNELAKIHQYFDLVREAEKYIDSAIKLDPNSAIFQNNRAIIMLMKGRFKQAEESFKKALELDGKEPSIWNDYGIFQMVLGKYEEAINAFKKAIQFNDRFVDAYINLGSIYLELNRLEEALEILKKAVDIDPESPEAWFNLGMAYKKLGYFEEAEKCRKKYLEILEKLSKEQEEKTAEAS